MLIVEDETLIAMHLESQLQRLGYAVRGVTASGEEAVKLAHELRPDLVLMDIRLDGHMDGIEAAEQIRETLRMPLLFVTSHTDETTVQRAKGAAPLGYIVKPFGERELHSSIQIALHRHELEKELAAKEQWWRTTLRSIGDGVVATDDGGQVVFMNSVAEKLTGWAEEEAVGRKIDEVMSLLSGDSLELANPVRQALQELTAFDLPEDTALRKKNGPTIQIEDAATPIQDSTGKLLGGVMVFRDVTQRRESETQLRQAHANLLRLNEDLDQFTYAASHDLQEPLRNIAHFSQLLARRYAGLMDAGGQECLTFIEEGAKRMEQMIHALRGYSRQTREARHDMAVADLNQVVSDAVANLQLLINESAATLSWGCLPALRVHREQITCVFQNLLSNALKYRKADTVPCIDITTRLTDSSTWLFSVRDNGIGFDPCYAERVFGVFKRLHRSAYPGTGIGLAICRRIVEQHGGRIWAESNLGCGSTFSFTLPDLRNSPGEAVSP